MPPHTIIARNDLGDRKGAIEDYDKAIKINPDYAAAYNNRDHAKAKSDDIEVARKVA